MKILKKVMQEVDIIEDIKCNKCGCTCSNQNFSNELVASQNFKTYDGLINIKIQTSPWSKKFDSENQYIFSLCENCTLELVKTFKHPLESK